jgi:hypothetical protein
MFQSYVEGKAVVRCVDDNEKFPNPIPEGWRWPQAALTTPGGLLDTQLQK